VFLLFPVDSLVFETMPPGDRRNGRSSSVEAWRLPRGEPAATRKPPGARFGKRFMERFFGLQGAGSTFL